MTEIGSVVKSLAGRDKGRLLLVTGVSDNGLLVCDGKERPLKRPKRKNPKHLEDTGMKIPPDMAKTDRSLKKLLAILKEESTWEGS